MASTTTRQATAKLLDRDEVDGVLAQTFFATGTDSAMGRVSASEPRDKPAHYKVICISLYVEDLSRLDQMVLTLKRRGYTKANRSALIRHALDAVELDRVPKGL